MGSAGCRRRTLPKPSFMPSRTTRVKPVVSYAESSSEDELALEVDDDDDDYDSESKEEQGPTPRPRSSLRSRIPPRVEQPPRSQQKRSRPSSSSSPHSQSGFTDSSSSRRPKRRKQSKQISPKTIPSINLIDGSGVIPPWQNLPYHVLVSIFEYATYPLYEEHTFQPLPSGQWLLNVARLCRDFAEPAFTVLYYSPPLVPMVQAHRLVDLLMADPIPMTFKYRQKVQLLRIDVGQVVAYSLPGCGHLDLYGLIKDLPRLTDLEFYHQKDMSPYRALDDNIKWTYPDSVFEALEYTDPTADPMRGDKTSFVKLRSWRWSSRMGGKKYSIEQIPQIHLKPTFSSLQKVAFVNYQLPNLKEEEEDPKHEAVLAQALSNLTSLKHLVFESSTLMNAKLLPMLPTGLRNLELINCWEIVAEDFAAFLLTHGRQLRVLTLNHNQSLSISFLPILGPACPNLQVFRMNLTYFNMHATYRDSEPQYDKLLEPDQIPTWPSTLQTIELTQLRKWEIVAAEAFFQSLLDSASQLPDLRFLTIQAILNIGWRDRASFRDKWVGALERVFKYFLKPPKPISSLRKANPNTLVVPAEEAEVVAESKRSSLQLGPCIPDDPKIDSEISFATSISLRRSSRKGQGEKDLKDEEPSPPARRSTRRAAQNLPSGIYSESSSAKPKIIGDNPTNRLSHLERELGILKDTAGKDTLITSASDTPSEGSDNEKANGKGKCKKKEVVQGLCEIVNVRIDNLRPTETQVTEADFLDEERSGDDDWNGDDDAVDGYAW
ncbi:hypothetical protein LZ554_002897 [Drepanopeziza brunnea f. sp. 'monogermtubi']|nr:hypothetical protein LZ554_002897 [Drepanopeziza brunnea f. sp. 'monogermtubi']